MQFSKLAALSVILCSIFSSVPAKAQDTETSFLKDCPKMSGWDYRCKDVVAIVNKLRSMGKSKSLSVLHTYLHEEDSDPKKIFIICRLLFVNTNKWDLPRLGMPLPSLYNTNSADLGEEPDDLEKRLAEDFPLFPIALSRGVPFFIIEGYALGGRAESPAPLLKQCETLEMISKDIPTGDYVNAARELVQSEQFRRLYPNSFRARRIEGMLLQQAGVESPPGRS